MSLIQKYRKQTYFLFSPDEGDKWGTRVDWFIMLLIAVNVTAVILQTVDSIAATYEQQFQYFEIFSVSVFTVEYLARVWSEVEGKWEDDVNKTIADHIRARIYILTRPLLIIDLVAILPFYLSVAGLGIDLRFLRALRLIRFLRLFKLARYSESMRAFALAFNKKKGQLIVAITANGLLLIIASSVMYFIETEAQPDVFGSIPEAMWWGIVTLTTVGYGAVRPVTPLGQVVGSVVAVLGIGLFALPASIMASGFIEESSYETQTCPDCGREIDWEQALGEHIDYDAGEWVRIDISSRGDVASRSGAGESELRYEDHQGQHGEIVEKSMFRNDEQTQYTVAIKNRDGKTDEKIQTTGKNLRTPYYGRERFEQPGPY